MIIHNGTNIDDLKKYLAASRNNFPNMIPTEIVDCISKTTEIVLYSVGIQFTLLWRNCDVIASSLS
jgi:hypothetical protein